MQQFYSLKDLKHLIYSSTSCIDFFNFSLGIHVRSEGQAVLAPAFIRSERHPSFAVYDNHCYDFTTCAKYSLLDIAALYHFGDNSISSICKAAELLSGKKLGRPTHEISDAFVSQQNSFNNIINNFHSNLLSNPIINPDGEQIHALDYFAQRRISLDTIKALKIGYSPKNNTSLQYMSDRLIFPYFLYDTDNPVYANGRAASPTHEGFPKYKKLALNDDRFNLILKNHVWGIHTQNPARTVKDTRINPNTGEKETLESHHIKYDYLIVTEGVFDTLAFVQEGYQVASSLGCGFSHDQKLELIDSAKHYAQKGKKVFLCLDNDKAGTHGQYDLALLLFKHRIPFVVGQVPSQMVITYELNPNFGQETSLKDVSDYYSAGGDLEKLILNAKPGVTILAEHCRNVQELENLFNDAAKFASKSDLLALRRAACSIMDDNGQVEGFDKVTGEPVVITDKKPRFDRITVNTLYSEACKPLQDKVISDMTCKAHQLMYDTAGKFYEYRAGIWRAVHDLIIQRYIADSMGGNISSNKISNVFKYLKISTAVQGLQFNAKPLWVFKNGTLFLDEPDGVGDVIGHDDDHTAILRTEPKNFKPSMPDDMASIQLSFDYRYGVKNEAWLRYISQWAGGKQDKQLRLQDMTGYVFYAANTLQKFFYLIGDGANGKSTFLHILQNLFGKENCSSLQFHRFSSEFDTIALKNSRLNICYDARTELGGAEDVLKAVSSGDSIMAAHKGVDAEAFTTNAKIFVAANRFFSASDVSKGLLRRILFVCFDQDFSGDNQKLDIEEEIMNDPGGLAGIFNWAYEGYKRLKASGKFTETEEEKLLIEEFKAQLSPLMVFAREAMYTRRYQTLDEKGLYELYSTWCKDNGEKRFSRTKFIYEIRQVLRTDGSRITDIKTQRRSDGMWEFVFPSRPASEHKQDLALNDEGDDHENESNETIDKKVQEKKATPDEESTHAHNNLLSGDKENEHHIAPENSKPAQTSEQPLDQQPVKEFVDDTCDPNYVHTQKPFVGACNQDIWDFAKKCIIYISQDGAFWKEKARSEIHTFQVYAAINLFSNHSKDAYRFTHQFLPGFSEFFTGEILPNFDIADDDKGTLIPKNNPDGEAAK